MRYPNGNLIGKDKDGRTCFTWQPHGSQFTIHEVVPSNAVKFKIKQPPVITQEDILKSLNFSKEWVEILGGGVSVSGGFGGDGGAGAGAKL